VKVELIYGPNTKGAELRVHKAGCRDIGRERKGATSSTIQEVSSAAMAAEDFYQDFIAEGSMTAEDALGYTEFLPCTAGLPTEENEMTTATKTPVTATTPAQDAEAALLAGVRTDPKPAKATPAKKTPAKAAAKTPAPAKTAAKTPAPAKTATEKILRPASKTVVAYVSWLKAELGPAEWAKLAKDPERLAQVSLTNYGAYRAQK
jgi:hypothetical protein